MPCVLHARLYDACLHAAQCSPQPGAARCGPVRPHATPCGGLPPLRALDFETLYFVLLAPATKVAAFLLDTDTSRSWASPHLSQVTRVASTNATSHEFAGIVVLLPSAGTPAVPFSVLPPHLCIETTNYWRI
jgi:hypothetical protein